jgi:hypothetical protein
MTTTNGDKMSKMEKVEYKCNECNSKYLEHDQSYVLEYPVASVEDRDTQWWNHWVRNCPENDTDTARYQMFHWLIG